MMEMKETRKGTKSLMKKILLLLITIILVLFLWEEQKDYEILHSTVMSSENLTETKLTIVIHSLLPIDEEKLAEEIVRNHQRLGGGHPNPYFQLELYRTELHYRLHLPYDTLLCDENGQIVTEIRLQ